jgi:hypothetical protein
LSVLGVKMGVYRADSFPSHGFGSKISEMESMRRMLPVSVCAVLMTPAPLFGQGMTLMGSGYTSPTTIRVAPGQVAMLFVNGLKTILSSQPVNATLLPLCGISVTLNQSTPLPFVCSSFGPAIPPPPS